MLRSRTAIAELIGVPAPTSPVYRLTKLGADPFAPPPWEMVGRNRFDDPKGQFRVIYCASEKAAAFGETMARFRRSLPLLALMAEIDDDDESLDESLEGLLDERDQERGVVPADWRFKRQIGMTTLDPHLEFLDVTAPDSVAHLRYALSSEVLALGMDDLDLSTILAPIRPMTRAIARYAYEFKDAAGGYRFAGIRYTSRYNLRWTCWAVFLDRLLHSPDVPETSIDPEDPALLEAADLLDLSIEGVRGMKHFVFP